MLFVPYAPPAANRRQNPQQRQHANRLALLGFAVTASAGLIARFW